MDFALLTITRPHFHHQQQIASLLFKYSAFTLLTTLFSTVQVQFSNYHVFRSISAPIETKGGAFRRRPSRRQIFSSNFHNRSNGMDTNVQDRTRILDDGSCRAERSRNQGTSWDNNE
jgi:hypothetical protein